MADKIVGHPSSPMWVGIDPGVDFFESPQPMDMEKLRTAIMRNAANGAYGKSAPVVIHSNPRTSGKSWALAMWLLARKDLIPDPATSVVTLTGPLVWLDEPQINVSSITHDTMYSTYTLNKFAIKRQRREAKHQKRG